MPGEVFFQALRSMIREWLKSIGLGVICIAGLLGWHAAGVPLSVRQAVALFSGESLPLSGWPEWLNAAGFNILFPLALCLPAILVGSQLMAGQEERGTIALVLAFPIPRWRIVIEKALGLTAGVLLVSTGLRLGLILPSLLWPEFALPAQELFDASFQLSLPATLFGSLALAIGSATGQLASARWMSLAAFAFWSGLVALSRLVRGFDFLSPLTDFFKIHFPLPNPLLDSLILVCVGLLAIVWYAAAMSFAKRDLND